LRYWLVGWPHGDLYGTVWQERIVAHKGGAEAIALVVLACELAGWQRDAAIAVPLTLPSLAAQVQPFIFPTTEPRQP
jgi:hypothetical protein